MSESAALPRSPVWPDRAPPAAAGLRIGLLGGSFDPPHEGHRMAGLLALHRLKLDAVWWLVSPGNPLKGAPEEDRAARIRAAAVLADHPRMPVTGIEAALGTRYTAETLPLLMRPLPGVRFVWVMGADNLVHFHRWRDWERIAAALPIAVVDRPGFSLRALASPAARALGPWRIPEQAAGALAGMQPPAWVFLHGPKLALSSTAIRRSRRQTGRPEQAS